MSIHTFIHSTLSLLLFLNSTLYPQARSGVVGLSQDYQADFPVGYPLSTGYQQDDELADSARTYHFEEIVVSAIRVRPGLAKSPASVSIVTSSEIRERGGTSLADVFSTVPGISIKNYGSVSGLKTISQRGLGAEHTLVLLNGVRLSSFQNGLVDLGLIPTAEIERIEILHGGNSAAYGSEAVAGVVNILTGPMSKRTSFQAETSLGSFGYQRESVGGGVALSQGGFSGRFQQERSAENFDFLFSGSPNRQPLTRRNADFASSYGTVQGYLRTSDEVELHAFAHTFTSERGAGGPVVSSTSLAEARQHDQDHLVQLSSRIALPQSVALTITWQTHYMYQRYRDPLLKIGGLTALDAYFKNIDDRIVSSAVAVLGSNVMLNAGGELARTRAEGNSIDVAAERLQAGGFVSGRYVLLEESGPLDDLSLFPSLRLDAFNTSRPAWSPQMACVIAFREFDGPLVNKLRPIIRGSISRNFRLPTFNELYYAGGGGFGNRLLRPERSITLEAGGGLYAEWNGYHVVRFSFFRNEMEDRIVWSPSGVMAVTPRNIRDVESGGTELSYVWDPLHGTLLLDANYAYIESRKTSADYPGDPNVNKRLVYVPTHAASLALTWSTSRPVAPIDRFGCVLSYQLVGRRFASEDNTTVLPAYDVADGTLFASWRLSSFEFQTRFEVRNLFDESYQIILGYPMPLRSYRVTLGLEY